MKSRDTFVAIVTPELAEEWLSRNEINRVLSKPKINYYAGIMKAGQWKKSDTNICFFEDGTLANGQHRLHAVIKAGVPVKMDIEYNVPRDMVFDRGKPRSTGDTLFLQGQISKEASSLKPIALVKFYLQIALKRPAYDHEIAQFIRDYENELLSVIALTYKSSNDSTMRNAPAQAALLGAVINGGFSMQEVERFCVVANTGFSDSPADSAAIVLRNTRMKMPKRLSNAERKEYCFMVQQAFINFALREPRKRKFMKPMNLWIKYDSN